MSRSIKAICVYVVVLFLCVAVFTETIKATPQEITSKHSNISNCPETDNYPNELILRGQYNWGEENAPDKVLAQGLMPFIYATAGAIVSVILLALAYFKFKGDRAKKWRFISFIVGIASIWLSYALLLHANATANSTHIQDYYNPMILIQFFIVFLIIWIILKIIFNKMHKGGLS